MNKEKKTESSQIYMAIFSFCTVGFILGLCFSFFNYLLNFPLLSEFGSSRENIQLAKTAVSSSALLCLAYIITILQIYSRIKHRFSDSPSNPPQISRSTGIITVIILLFSSAINLSTAILSVYGWIKPFWSLRENWILTFISFTGFLFLWLMLKWRVCVSNDSESDSKDINQ